MTYADPHTEESLASFMAKLDIHFGRAARQMDRLALMLATANKAAQPVFYRQQRSYVATAAGIAILDFTGPDQGHFWYVKSIAVGGITPTTVAAGRADVFVSAADAPLTATGSSFGGILDWRDQSLSLPSIAFYGDGIIPLRMNEELVIVVSNATAGQTYAATLQIVDFQESAATQVWPK